MFPPDIPLKVQTLKNRCEGICHGNGNHDAAAASAPSSLICEDVSVSDTLLTRVNPV